VALIGQHQSCRVNLADDSVSRVHCSLVRTRWGIWVVDLMGRGGTFVNGKLVECARLEDGCELGVGKFRIQLTFGAESAQRSHTERFPATSESVPATKATTLGEPAQKEPIRLAVRSDRESPQGLTRTADSGPPSDSFPTPGVEFPNLDRQSTDSFSEPFVISLIKEFAAMQQQMFVQSQQAMMTMAQMLTTVHQDQMALFRDELTQVRSLNRELQQLRLQLKQTQPESEADSPSPADLDRVERLLLDHTDHVDENGSEPVDVSPTSGTTETTDAAEPDEVADSPEPSSAADDAEDRASSQSKTDGYEAHAWLCQRMAVIEKERNSRWKKILKALRGGFKDRSHHDALVDGGVDDSVT
jgi:pSer/pThr/pTyr-binding forkhead associated (FHA) protein